MDFLSNVVLGLVVIVINFLLLVYTEEVLDLVLNSTAIFFALELDEGLVNVSEGSIKNMHRNFIINDLNKNIQKEKYRHYWDEGKKLKNKCSIHVLVNCDLILLSLTLQTTSAKTIEI